MGGHATNRRAPAPRLRPILSGALFLAAIFLFSPDISAQQVLTEREFAEFYASVLSRQPGDTVRIDDDLAVVLVRPDGDEHRLLLHRLYRDYLANPSGLDTLVAEHSAQIGFETGDVPLDPASLLPILRHWSFEELLPQDDDALESYRLVDMTRELSVFIVRDTPETVHYLGQSDLAGLFPDKQSLLVRALTNLYDRSEQIRVVKHREGFYQVLLDGFYESSVLLLMPFWRDIQDQVRGDVVAAAPKRSILLFTGDEEPDGVASMDFLAAQVPTEPDHPMATTLLRFTGDGWIQFNPRYHPE